MSATSSALDGMMPARAGEGPNLQRWVKAGLFVLLAILILIPLLILFRTSFSPAGTLPFETNTWTLANFQEVATTSGAWVLIRNTLVYALCSVAIGIAIATAIAWLTERTDMPGRTVMQVMMYSWMAVPPLVFGYGWILLLNPGNGVVNVLARSWFDIQGPLFTPYSMTSLIVISGLGLVPTAYVMLSGLLRNMDPSLENAALVHGARPLRVLRSVTLPLLTPGLLSSGIFLVMAMIQTFDLPLIIGLTARVPVFSTRIFLLTSPDSGSPNFGLAAAFGVALLVLAGLLMWAYFRATRYAERFRVVTGKGFRPRRVVLGRYRFVALGGVSLYIALMLLPLLMLFWASLLPYYRLPTWAALSSASFASYARILDNATVVRALGNTVLLVFSSATLVMVLSCLISWFSVRAAGRTGKWLDILSFSPTAIPAIVIAMAVLLFYIHTPLYGTIWILVVGHVTIYLAFGTRAMNGAIIQVHRELEDAAVVCGATWFASLRKIVFPLLSPHILNAWLWVVAHSARDLTFALLLMNTRNIVAASAIYTLWDAPDLPGAAALAMLVVGALLLVVLPIQVGSALRARRNS